jgi:hypothetical protein
MFYFNVEQSSIKKEIENIIEKNVSDKDLIVVFVSGETENEINWIDKEEFNYKGSMYDVVKTFKDSQGTRYYCISDKKETALLAELDEHIKNYVTGSGAGKPEKNKSKIFFKKHIVPQKEIILFEISEKKILYSEYTFSTKKDFFRNIFIPPPEKS